MTNQFWLGMTTVFFGGLLTGSFAAPMKYTRHWKWENTWLTFSLVSLILLPWLLAGTLVPQLKEVYRGVGPLGLLAPLGFGFLWGIAQTTYGIAIRTVGMTVAIATVAGLSCFSGSLVPLLVFSPGDLFRPRGVLLLISIAILFLGLTLYGKAGRQREREQVAPNFGSARIGERFATGLAVCVFTGLFGSSINLGFAFSRDILRQSLYFGANQLTSTYAVWALVLAAGFIPNLLYCAFLLVRNHSWLLFLRSGWAKELCVAAVMALLFWGGIVSYGIGATLVGAYGTSLGFALLTASQILSSSALGIVGGEWKATSTKTHRLLAAAVALTTASVVVLNLGGIF